MHVQLSLPKFKRHHKVVVGIPVSHLGEPGL